ncbi:MAG: hypothetical protein A2639_02035 [Candidatus Staskawiczbacteria bacterium RIFCSPHIGHO2_01_FULL_34_27]|uniref:Haem-binding uptake Tiki superfamily ChaN domain-containing protein n=1 Tax=Candidatus Staskawiczbacteria bacterium RIFCSPHIGHO2_01_FULL_34_27 TaxID=1802199 RepID=A0A1G2HL16_9BACT|nr:MAG: hypothetical protein A2639_02035 [Candidatus Staskawiczbacteria bacterium RIFCSPHIGHO2_01_FULL_34_27]
MPEKEPLSAEEGKWIENNEGVLEFHKQEFIAAEQLDKWNDKKYHIEKFGDNISVVVLGEKHTNTEFTEKQLELINIIKPEYVLSEFWNGWIYNPKTQKFEQQNDRVFDKNYDFKRVGMKLINLPPEDIKLILAANKISFKIVGCDLTMGELKEIAKQFPDKYANKPDYFIGVIGADNEVMPFRDEQMVKTISEYQQKSLKPIISIMGWHHGDSIHNQKIMQEKGFGYAYINENRRDK